MPQLRADTIRDIRHTLRAVRREPGFYGLAVLIIGLGVGACAAVFSVMSPFFVRALPFHDPDRLVWIANSGDPEDGMSAVTSRTSNLRDFRALSESFDGITGYNAFFEQGSYNLVGGGEPERLSGAGVAQDFLPVLGVPLLYGRNFLPEESVSGGRPAVILSHGFWMRRFGGDPSIVGTPISLNGEPTEVVGVLPPSFDFASTFAPGARVDFLLPWPISDETDRQGNTTSMIGRLEPGVTVGRAQAELDRILAGLRDADPERWGLGARVSDLRDRITGSYRSAMLLLAAAASTFMLIVCVNLSNLLIARASRRSKEMAVRTALGASRTRLLRKMLVESLVLTLGGAVIGVGIAVAITRFVADRADLDIALVRTVAVDGTALLFTLCLAILAGLGMAIAPALQATRGGLRGAMGETGRGTSAGRRRTRLREVLVTAEVAMAYVLLVFSGLFLGSLRRVLDVDMGFEPAGAFAWTLSITNHDFGSMNERRAYLDRVVERIQAVPGIESVGMIDALPLGRNRQWGTIRAVGAEYEDGELQGAFPHLVDHRYLSAMEIPLVAGRGFAPTDVEDRPPVVILNESAARGVFRGEDPVGKMARIIGQDWEVIGVVSDVRHQSLEQGAGWEMYFAYPQIGGVDTWGMVVRSSLPDETLVPAVEQALRAVDPSIPTREYQALTDLVDHSVSPRRFLLLLLSAFGGTALILAALGIYGVLSFAVAEQLREIGIRMALGASSTSIRRRVVAKTLSLAGLGVAIGAASSFVGTRTVVSLLYGVDPADPLTFSIIAMLLLAIALFAGYVPALRASRVDPTTAFRSV